MTDGKDLWLLRLVLKMLAGGWVPEGYDAWAGQPDQQEWTIRWRRNGGGNGDKQDTG